jgi:cytochrome d ubiquinol oxidase subunit I
MIPLNMHRFVGNFSYVGFLIVGWAAYRYLRTEREDDREYYDWMGHWGLIWGFGFLIMQPIIGYGYLKNIRESAPEAFNAIMLGDKAWLFNLLMVELAVMGVASTAYCVHKLRFAVKPMDTLRMLSIGGLAFIALFSVLNLIPADVSIVPQIGLEFLGGNETKIPLGSMYPWKYIGLIGLMLVGVFVVALYLRASATGFHWGRASRWSQWALIACAVTVVLTMVTMGYTRETARRVDNNPGYLIYNCITLEQELTPETCPAGESLTERMEQEPGR